MLRRDLAAIWKPKSFRARIEAQIEPNFFKIRLAFGGFDDIRPRACLEGTGVDKAPKTDFLDSSDIAIVGMASHLPGAGSVEAYWQNLRHGVSSIRRFTKDELIEAGETAHVVNRPDYVPAGAPLEDFEKFDAEFFGLSPKDAAIMDPQHRQFLEVAWRRWSMPVILPKA